MFITGAIPDNLINMPLTKKGKEIMSALVLHYQPLGCRTQCNSRILQVNF